MNIEDELKDSGTTTEPMSYQQRVHPWMIECFGEDISNDPVERNRRFLEEALELVQACDCTREEAHQLVDYVFNRPVGEKAQEVGGVMVTLAALCGAHKLAMHHEGETELARVWTKVDVIREKQLAKKAIHVVTQPKGKSFTFVGERPPVDLTKVGYMMKRGSDIGFSWNRDDPLFSGAWTRVPLTPLVALRIPDIEEMRASYEAWVNRGLRVEVAAGLSMKNPDGTYQVSSIESRFQTWCAAITTTLQDLNKGVS